MFLLITFDETLPNKARDYLVPGSFNTGDIDANQRVLHVHEKTAESMMAALIERETIISVSRA